MANNVTLAFPPAFCQQFFDRNGKPLSGGRLYTFKAGTRTSIVTYKTIGDTTSANRNTNPIVLDSAGYANLVLKVGKSYRLVLTDRFGSVINEWDNVTASLGGGCVVGTEYTAGDGIKIDENDVIGIDSSFSGQVQQNTEDIAAIKEDVHKLDDAVAGIGEKGLLVVNGQLRLG